MSEQITQSERYFDLIANIYDNATKSKNTWNPPSLIYDNIKKYISNNSILLDIGIGTGQSSAQIYKNEIYKNLYGVDISQKMIEECKKKYPNIFLKQISSINEILNLSVDKFDIIIASGLIEFIKDIELFFSIIGSIIQENGYFVFTYEPIIEFHPYQQYKSSLTVPNKDSSVYIEDFYTYRYTPLDMKKYLEQFNFSIINEIEFIAYEKGSEKIIYHLFLVTKNHINHHLN